MVNEGGPFVRVLLFEIGRRRSKKGEDDHGLPLGSNKREECRLNGVRGRWFKLGLLFDCQRAENGVWVGYLTLYKRSVNESRGWPDMFVRAVWGGV